MTTRSKAKEGNQNIRKVAHKAQAGKVKKNNSANGSSIRNGNKAQTPKSGSDVDLKQRRRKYGSNVNISEISELVSMSNLTQRWPYIYTFIPADLFTYSFYVQGVFQWIEQHTKHKWSRHVACCLLLVAWCFQKPSLHSTFYIPVRVSSQVANSQQPTSNKQQAGRNK